MAGAETQVALLGATQALALFTVMNPPIGKVRNADSRDLEFVTELRTGEKVAGLLAIGIGVAAAIHSRSLVPLLLSGITVLALVAVYEYHLGQSPASAESISQEG